MGGVGEELPDGLRKHGRRSGGKIHEPKPPCMTREESDMLARAQGRRIGRNLFDALSGDNKAGDCPLHGGEMADRVRWEERLLVNRLRRQALVGSVDPAKKTRIKVQPTGCACGHPSGHSGESGVDSGGGVRGIGDTQADNDCIMWSKPVARGGVVDVEGGVEGLWKGGVGRVV